MRNVLIAGLVWLGLLLAPVASAAPEDKGSGGSVMGKISALDWKKGPGPQALTERATINLPKGTMYLDSASTSRFLELTGNLPEPASYTIAANDLSWFAIFDFNDMGYVKDDEKIDPEALLKSMKESQEAANEERQSKGLGTLDLVGWSVVPHYDVRSHNLEFGTKLHAADGDNLNYTMRMLGRRGVMNATLITTQETLERDLAAFRPVLAGFAYKPDESYAAYKEGDKVSEYGLAALVAGGAAAAAAKGGLFKGLLLLLAKFGKIIAIGFIAALASMRRFIGRLFGRGEDLGPPPA